MAQGFDPPWRLDPFQNIVNVGWGGALWLLVYVYMSSGNNSVDPNGDASVTFPNGGGDSAPNLFTAGSGNPVTLRADQELSHNIAGANDEFILQTEDQFSSNKQALILFKIRPPEATDPNKVNFTFNATVRDLTSAQITVALTNQSFLVDQEINLKENVVGFELGTVFVAPAEKIVAGDSDPLIINYTIDRKAKTISGGLGTGVGGGGGGGGGEEG